VHRKHEPITPFVDRVRELYDLFGVSTVLVMGGCGDYFDVADTVIMMRNYEPTDVTDEARRIAAEQRSGRIRETREAMTTVTPRVPLAQSFDASRGRRDVKIATKSRELILYGEHAIDLRHVPQLMDTSQTRAVAMAIHLASEQLMAESGDERAGADAARPTLAQALDALEDLFDTEGLDRLDPYRRQHRDAQHPGSFARPRRYEIAAAINRLRCLDVEQQATTGSRGPRGYQSAS